MFKNNGNTALTLFNILTDNYKRIKYDNNKKK